jgi:hypothetical protein
MGQDLLKRLAASGGVLAIMLLSLAGAASLGTVHIGAGDIKFVLDKGDTGLRLDMATRTCPPTCGVDIAWRPIVR